MFATVARINFESARRAEEEEEDEEDDDDDAEVLKEGRSPRERGRMGTSVTRRDAMEEWIDGWIDENDENEAEKERRKRYGDVESESERSAPPPTHPSPTARRRRPCAWRSSTRAACRALSRSCARE
jgi:hypothetical protein